MKKSRILCLALFGLLCHPALASEAAHNTRGYQVVGGSFSYSTSSFSDGLSESSFSVSAPLLDFVLDRFAIGGIARYSRTSVNGNSSSSYALGPEALYYFYQLEQIALYVSESPMIHQTTHGHAYYSLSTALGLDYFVIPSVAFGPALTYYHGFENSAVYGEDTVSFSAGFTIFL